jgi:hypothetical protein
MVFLRNGIHLFLLAFNLPDLAESLPKRFVRLAEIYPDDRWGLAVLQEQ